MIVDRYQVRHVIAGAEIYECRDCGAAVFDRDLHNEHHVNRDPRHPCPRCRWVVAKDADDAELPILLRECERCGHVWRVPKSISSEVDTK